MVAGSLPLFAVLVFRPDFWPIPVALFVIGWIFQFAGHYAEGKPPEFFHDWHFLFVGLRWWAAKMRGKASPSTPESGFLPQIFTQAQDAMLGITFQLPRDRS